MKGVELMNKLPIEYYGGLDVTPKRVFSVRVSEKTIDDLKEVKEFLGLRSVSDVLRVCLGYYKENVLKNEDLPF